MTPIATARVFEALYRHDAAKIDIAIQRGLDPMMCNEEGAPLLHEAAFVGAAPIVAALLAAGANPNERLTSEDELPLHCAIMSRGVAATQAKPLESLDDLSAVDRVAWSAAQGDARATVDALIQAGAHIDARANDGKTALMVAIAERQTDLVARLLELGADPTARSGALDPAERITVVQMARAAAKTHPEILAAVQARLPAQLDLLGGLAPEPATEEGGRRPKP